MAMSDQVRPHLWVVGFCFLTGFGWYWLVPFGGTQLASVGLVLLAYVIVGLCALFVSLRQPYEELKSREALGMASRLGLKVGITAVLATFVVVLMVTAIRFYAQPNLPENPFYWLAWRTSLVFLATALGSPIPGLLGSLAGLGYRKPVALQVLFASLSRRPHSGKSVKLPVTPYRILLLILVAVAVLAFQAILTRPEDVPPKPVQQAKLPAALPAVEKELPPPFSYTVPDNFSEARPWEIDVAAINPLEDLEIDAPVVFSRDSNLLAFLGSAGGEWRLKVLDTRNFEIVEDLPLPDQPGRIAWSPDNARIFCSHLGSLNSCVIADLRNDVVIALPFPQLLGVSSEDLEVVWEDDGIVTFNGSKDFTLDLQTLQFADAELDLPDAEQALPSTSSWTMAVAPRYTRVSPPRFGETDAHWNLAFVAAVGFEGRNPNLSRLFDELGIERGDVLLPSPDGTRLLLNRRGVTEIVYFRWIEPFQVAHRVPTPVVQTEAKILRRSFVYAPLRNPLNNRVIGADRKKIKGVIRLVPVSDHYLGVASEVYQPFQPSDIVTDAFNPQLMPETGWPEITSGIYQFAAVGDPDTPGPLPECGVQSHKFVAGFEPVPAGLRFTGLEVQEEKLEPQVEQAPSKAPIEQAPSELQVETFLRDHYRKLGQNDYEALAQDFSPVIVQEKEEITAAALVAQEQFYSEQFDQREFTPELVAWDITDDQTVSVVLDLDYRISLRGVVEALTGTERLMLHLRPADGELQIIRQDKRQVEEELLEKFLAQAKAETVQESASQGSRRMPLSQRINKPYYLGRFPFPDVANVHVTDQIHVRYAKMYWDRTFEDLDSSGNMVRWCRMEMEGSASRERPGYLRLRVQSYIWAEGGDESLEKQVEYSIRRIFNQRFYYKETRDGISFPEYGLVWNLQK